MSPKTSRTHFPLNLIVLAVGTLLTSLPAAAQETLDTVVVTGMKASLQKAQDLKRNADQIVDSIVADDIGKLPDANVAEALQRIAGVQISRDQGEGSKVQVRGLSQTQTTLNGRAIFTAGKERGLSFQDVPAELLAGADVFKTPTADQIEGGIGGLIDLRTRRPFDFAGLKLAGTVKMTRADLAKKDNTEGSFLVSDRWKLDGGSEFGALLSVASQKRNYRADKQELGAPGQLSDKSGIYAPTGVYSAYELGTRDRTGISGSLQLRASPDLEFYLDANRTELKTRTDGYSFYASPFWANYSSTTNLGQLWPNGAVTTTPSKVFQKGTFYGADMNTSGNIADNDTTTSQVAIGGSWKTGGWTIKSELGYTKSDFQRLYNELRLGVFTNNPGVAFDLTTATPSAYPVLGGANDLTTASQYYASKSVYFKQVNQGTEKVARLDGERRIEGGGWLTKLRTGVRATDRTATSAEINDISDIYNSAGTGPVGGALPSLQAQVGVIPYNNLLSTAGAGKFPASWLSITDLNFLRNPTTSRQAVGLAVPAFDVAQTFDFSEKSSAVYGVADFDTSLMGKSLTGNVGLRYVNTKSEVRYTQVLGAVSTPKDVRTTDNDWLPSLNVRMELSDKLIGRFAASKVVTRPDFGQLTPSGSFNVNDRTGYRGNPALKPLSAEQADVSLEYYLSKSDHIYGAGFVKKVSGFIQDSTSQIDIGGVPYSVKQPANGQDGRIKGLELGYQAFFTSLPGAFKGLGLQANYTYVSSSAPGPLGGKTELAGLSKDSANLIGMYDYQAFSLRLAYNYRSKYLIGTHDYYPNDSTVIGQTPVYLKGYSMVDAYVSYGITPHLRVALEANNITNTVRRSYYGIDNMPMGTYADGRRYAISLHMEL